MNPSANVLEVALLETVQALDEMDIPYMLVGGMASSIWGEPRYTSDVDLTIQWDNTESQHLWERLKNRFRFMTDDPAALAVKAGAVPIVSRNGLKVDLILGNLPLHQEGIAKAIGIPIQGQIVKVCPPEQLVILKSISDRAKDREDVLAILRHQRGHLNLDDIEKTLGKLAQDFDEPSIMDFWRQARGVT